MTASVEKHTGITRRRLLSAAAASVAAPWVLPGVSGDMLEVQARFRPGSAGAVGLKLHLFFDRSVLEVFIDGGRKSVTKVVYPPQGVMRSVAATSCGLPIGISATPA